jgi:hypothetical protein
VGEIFDRSLSRRNEFVGVFVLELVHFEVALLGDFESAVDRLGMLGEKPVHLLGRFEIAFGVGKEFEAGVVDGAAVADAGENILKRATAGVVIIDGVGGEERNLSFVAESDEVLEMGFIIDPVKARDGEGKAGAQNFAKFEKHIRFPLPSGEGQGEGRRRRRRCSSN